MESPKKTVLITGASSGFGKVFVETFLNENYTVIAAIRGGETRGKEIFHDRGNQISNKELVFIDIHLESPASILNSLKQVFVCSPMGIDVLINNAGLGVFGPIELQKMDDIRYQFEVNFFSVIQITQILMPLLRKKNGKIFNISSVAGFCTFPNFGSYSASKHALDALTEGLYYDLSDSGVQVCAIQPGGFKTSFSSALIVPSKDPNGVYMHYENHLTNFSNFTKVADEKLSKDPSIVARKVFSLTKCKKLPPRVQIGSDCVINLYLKKILPDGLRIKLIKTIFKYVFKI